uniref:Uncharacterized protein n=1 Tax=Cannabis sativa TaxID=3483 RepID=A0A803QFN8_CANSA
MTIKLENPILLRGTGPFACTAISFDIPSKNATKSMDIPLDSISKTSLRMLRQIRFKLGRKATLLQLKNHALLPQLFTTQYRQLLNLLAAQQNGMNANDPSSSTGNPSIILSHNCAPPLHNS